MKKKTDAKSLTADCKSRASPWLELQMYEKRKSLHFSANNNCKNVVGSDVDDNQQYAIKIIQFNTYLISL